ncbi:MAG: response regulator [Verrucomicrobiota bacterium]
MSPDSQPSVLVVDDSETDLEIISMVCSGLGCNVDLASDGFEALRLYEERRHDLILTDYFMEPMNGIYVISRIKELNPNAVCLIVTGFPNHTLRRFVEEGGVKDLIVKPIQATLLKETIRSALKGVGEGTKRLSGIALSNRMDNCPALVGDCTEINALRKQVAPRVVCEKPLLLIGPHGSGKYQIADFIHQNGPNADRPPIHVSCANMGEKSLRYDLIAEGGEWRSILRQAEGGTLILDQILALPLSVQADLAKHFEAITTKMHLIALTDQSVDDALQRGEIDDAFYFKLTTDLIEVPLVGVIA